MIIGADWLEEHSPTWIHWKRKIMRYPHNGRRVKIEGIIEQTASCTGIGPTKLKCLLRRNGVAYCVQMRRIVSNSKAEVVHAIQELSETNGTMG
jgi:hypothetical protein